MNPKAVERAKARLERAEAALAEFKAASNYAKAESAWTDFLWACSSIYSQLEQGAKGFSLSGAWYGRKKHERRTHPVLRYIHYARNADEHGIEFVTERQPDGGEKQAFGQKTEWTLREVDKTTMQPFGPEVRAWLYGPHVKLTRAYDNRYSDYCDPPPFDDQPPNDPAVVGDAAVALLRAILLEATALT